MSVAGRLGRAALRAASTLRSAEGAEGRGAAEAARRREKGKGKKKEKVEIAMEPALPLAELLGSTNFPQTDGEYYVTTRDQLCQWASPHAEIKNLAPHAIEANWRRTYWTMPHKCGRTCNVEHTRRLVSRTSSRATTG